MLKSHSLRYSDYNTQWYKFWAKQLKQTENDNLGNFMLFSNKFWQNAVIAQSLYERGLLQQGRKGIGFGVGKERLPALFAKYGVVVTATDQDFRTKRAKHWQGNELATEINQLNDLQICSPDLFSKNVSLAPADMRKIPSKYQEGYDFVWSNCALGHLGSIDAGLKFIVDSASCLRPGGYAIHTTELNVLNNDETVTSGDTVIFRPKDMMVLDRMLKQAGYELKPFRLTLGSTKKDNRVSMSPKFGTDCSKIQVGGHVATQIVLIIHRPVTQKGLGVFSSVSERFKNGIYKRNVRAQKRLAQSNKFIRIIHESERNGLKEANIKPTKNRYTITLNKPTYVYISYKNTSRFPLFTTTCRLFSTKPILLATGEPKDRNSIFKANDWYNGQANRPSVYLYKKLHGKWHEIDYVHPGEEFAFRLLLDPTDVKRGKYTEVFHIVQEGAAHLEKTSVVVEISV